LSAVPSDGNPVIHEHAGAIVLAHNQEHPRQEVFEQEQELANSKGSFAHRLCAVECNIDQLTSILKSIENTLSNMGGQVLESNGAQSIGRNSSRKSIDSNMTFSRGSFESSGAAHQPDAVPHLCNHDSALSKESSCVSEHLGHLASVEIADRQHREDASAQVEYGHIQAQLMHAKASRCPEQVMLLNESHLCQKCSIDVEESDTAAQMPTDADQLGV